MTRMNDNSSSHKERNASNHKAGRKQQFQQNILGANKRTLLIVTLAGTLVAAPIGAVAVPGYSQAAQAAATTAATAQPDQLILNSETPITAGATLRTYTWKTTHSNKSVTVNARAVVIDLTNPNVKLEVMSGTGGQFTKNQTIAGMTKETGAVAGINGDFFNTKADGAPQGPQISGGTVMSSAPLLTGFYGFALTKDRKPIIDQFSFSGVLNAADGTTFPLGGINKAPYWYGTPSTHAMIDSMFIYTSAWGSATRAVDRATDLLEVLVVDGVVQQIQKGSLKIVPPENGYIIRTEGTARTYVLDHLKIGDAVSYTYQMKGAETGDMSDSSNLEVLIGGGTMLVDQGKAVDKLSLPNSADPGSQRSRTAIGYSKDGKTAYLVTADQVDGVSAGATLKEMGRLLAQIGAWRALNMDGGGSTQMVSRPLGEQTPVVVNGLENAWQRPVVNGFGVYSTAPQGQAAGLIVSGPKFVLMGEAVKFTLKGYDQYYNPLGEDALASAVWTTSDPKGLVQDGSLTMASAGKATVTAAIGNVKTKYDVQLIGRDDIENMTVLASSSVALENSSIKLSVKIKTKSGEERTVPGQLFQWELQGIDGSVDGDMLRIDSFKEDSRYAQIIARYDGYGAMTRLPVGVVKTLLDWDSPEKSVAVTFTSTAGVTGTVSPDRVTDNEQGQPQGQGDVMELAYDMTQGTTDTKAAYLTFQSGFQPEGEPQTIQMLVRGDQSLNWLRAELMDADGKLYYVDLAKTINWQGWKQVSADLSGLKMKYPVKLNRLYVASIKEGEDERTPVGSVAFDQISFLYKQALPTLPKNTAWLKVGSKTIKINGKEEAIDVAPVIIDSRTYVPIRFIVDAMGGDVQWEPNEKRVTVIRGSQMIEMRAAKKELTVNGKLIVSDAAPVIRNDRTLVPLRLLSEQFGWKVDWNAENKEVTLQ